MTIIGDIEYIELLEDSVPRSMTWDQLQTIYAPHSCAG
jgi:hypothetical protein